MARGIRTVNSARDQINKRAEFIRSHGFKPHEEECGECGLSRREHNPGLASSDCVFERTGRKWRRG